MSPLLLSPSMTEYIVADVFLKAAAPSPALHIPHAASLSDLRIALTAHSRASSLLQLELDTLGEDWLFALQDELTKPYFLSVYQ